MWILVCSWRNVKEGKGDTKRTRQVIIYCTTCHGNCRRLIEPGQLTAGTTRPRFRSTEALVQPVINGSADVTLVVHLHVQQIFQSKRPLEKLWTADSVADNSFSKRKVKIRITALFFAMHIGALPLLTLNLVTKIYGSELRQALKDLRCCALTCFLIFNCQLCTRP